MASYYVWSGAAGSNNGSSWANAFTTLTAAFVPEVAGDTLYVAHDHAESSASSITLTSSGSIGNPTRVVCVNRAGTVPPVSADRRATATVTTTAASDLTIAGAATYYDGIIFSAGTGTTSSANFVVLNAVSAWVRFDNCSLRLGLTGVGSGYLKIGGSAGSLGNTYVELNNTTVSFAHTNSGFQIVGMMRWRSTPSALLGTIPNLLFSPVPQRGGSVECIGVDLSAAGSGKSLVWATSGSQVFTAKFIDCKLNAAVTKADVPLGHGSGDTDFIRSGAAGVNYAVHRQRISGMLTEETTIVRTGGASDGTTPIAWKIVTTANCTYSMPFECPPIAIWNDTVGSAVTATVEGIWGGGAVPNDDECFLEVEYLGDASSPLASRQ